MQTEAAQFLKLIARRQKLRRGKMPGGRFCRIDGARQKHITRMPIGAQPGDQPNEIAFRHRRATGRRASDAAANVKEDRAAVVRQWWIGIVPNLNQPAICEIVVPHFFLREPRRRMRRILDRDEAVVVRAVAVVDPGVGCRHLMKRKVGAGRKRGVVRVDFSDLENARGRAAVPFVFVPAGFILAGNSPAPGETVFAKENRHRFAHWSPRAGVVALETLQLAAGAVPIRRGRDDELPAVVRQAGGTRAARENEKRDGK